MFLSTVVILFYLLYLIYFSKLNSTVFHLVLFHSHPTMCHWGQAKLNDSSDVLLYNDYEQCIFVYYIPAYLFYFSIYKLLVPCATIHPHKYTSIQKYIYFKVPQKKQFIFVCKVLCIHFNFNISNSMI